MLAIVNGRAIDAVRSVQSSATRDIVWGRRQCDVAFDVTADRVHATADAKLVREALQDLSDKQRSALGLAFDGRYSTEWRLIEVLIGPGQMQFTVTP